MHENQKGFGLMEIMIAALLTATVAAGVLATLVNAKRVIRPTDSIAGYLARERLETLYEAVRQDWWGAAGNPLSVGGPTPDNVTVDNITYNRSYTVTAINANGDAVPDDYRRVDLTITWPN